MEHILCIFSHKALIRIMNIFMDFTNGDNNHGGALNCIHCNRCSLMDTHFHIIRPYKKKEEEGISRKGGSRHNQMLRDSGLGSNLMADGSMNESVVQKVRGGTFFIFIF